MHLCTHLETDDLSDNVNILLAAVMRVDLAQDVALGYPFYGGIGCYKNYDRIEGAVPNGMANVITVRPYIDVEVCVCYALLQGLSWPTAANSTFSGSENLCGWP